MRKSSFLVGLLVLVALGRVGATAPSPALEKAMQARTLSEALTALSVVNPEAGKRVLLDVADIAVSGKSFTVSVTSKIPGTDWIAILAEREDVPFLRAQDFQPGLDHRLSLDVTLKRTGRIHAVVRAGGKYYQVSREVKLATQDVSSK